MRQLMKYGALLIGGYLLVAYATGSGAVITKATSGASNVIRSFQGR